LSHNPTSLLAEGCAHAPMELARPGFSVYTTLGYPSPEEFPRLLKALAPCVDFLELGCPTARPKYDGPTVRKAHRTALEKGADCDNTLRKLGDEDLGKPFTLMAYLEDHRDNLRGLLEAAASTGAGCVLLPDLAFDYPHRLLEYVEESERAGMRPCFFASSRFPHSWLMRFSSLRPLYVYLGLQPATGVELPITVARNVATARRLLGDAYLLAGFAIRRPETARELIDAGADAVVVGSALLRTLGEQGMEEVARFACGFHRAIHSAKPGGVGK